MANPGKYVVDAIASAAETPRLLGVTAEGVRRIVDWVSDAFQETLTRRAKPARRTGAARSSGRHPAAKTAKRGAKRARATAKRKPSARAPKKSKKAAAKKTAKRAGRPAKMKHAS